MKRITVTFSFITADKVGRATVKQELKRLVESHSGTISQQLLYRQTKVVDREPLFKVGEKVFVWLPKNALERSKSQEFKATVIGYEPMPSAKGWLTEMELTRDARRYLGTPDTDRHTWWEFDTNLRSVK